MDPQNQYGFIMDSSPNRSSGPAFLQDPKKRIIVAVLFVISILLLIVLAFAAITSLNNKSTSAMVDVAAYQTEIARICTLGLTTATNLEVRAQTVTLQSFIASDLTQTTKHLAGVGKKLDAKDIALRTDTTVVKNLESAKLQNTYDEELSRIITKITASYKLSLQKALSSASSEREKQVLQTAATNILTFEGN
jgi:hypothetical protein